MNKKEEKITVGQQLLDAVKKAEGDKGPEAREVSLAWGKKFLKDLEKIAEDPKYKKWNFFYIKILAKKQVYAKELVSVVYGVTSIPPKPSWKHMLYSYNRLKNEWKLHWVLPQSPEIARVMLGHEEGFDSILINSIKKYLKEELIGQKNY